MNKLQKYSWFGLINCAVVAPITIATLFHLSSRNIQGIGFVLIFIIIAPIITLMIFLQCAKFRASLDERERLIYSKANMWSTNTFVGFMLLFSFISFFVIGGKGSIPVLALPVAVMIGLFIAQLTESSIILVTFMLESQDAN